MNYCIIESSTLSSVDFNLVGQTSESTVRKSLDGSKAVLKFEGSTPAFLDGVTIYNISEIAQLLSGPEWSSEEENI